MQEVMSTDNQYEEVPNSTTVTLDSSEPLLFSESKPHIVSTKNSPCSSSMTDNRRISIDHAHNFALNGKKHVPPHVLSYNEGETSTASRNMSVFDDNKPHPDISAMSVLSLIDANEDLDDEMNTDRDLIDMPTISTQINIENDVNQIKETSQGNGGCDCDSSSQRKLKGNIPLDNTNLHCQKPVIYFNDGKRSVDFVLVWDSFEEDANTEGAHKARRMFEESLMKEGLQLEYELPEKNGLNFVKIHAPKEVLRRYSEILKLRMPMKEIPGLHEMQDRTNFLLEGFNSQWEKVRSFVTIDEKKFPEKSQRFTAIYSRDREYLFDVDASCFFTPAIHSRIVQFILDRKKFCENPSNDFAFGIERLLNEKIYSAAYPLHDGDLRTPGSMRYLLFMEWTSIRKWYRYQPLDYVKEYFGVKIALYFAWLGFYTHMLFPAALVGIACLLYSWVTLYDNKPSEDICNEQFETMCPACDNWCDYWDLKETCVHARITYLFDNPTTVFFAIFMSFWATLFLELWKRYSAEITHRWDLTGFDVKEEHPRPQYLARLSHVKRKQINIVTNTMEPYVSFWRNRLPATIFSFSVVLLLIVLALATVVAVVLYRMSVMTALRVHRGKVTTSYAILFTTTTAACINLGCIVVFNWMYTYLAEYLTELELWRTQSQFDDSLTLKIYLLQFINYYASIFYIAFFKGKFIGYPQKYNKIFGYRQEECGPGGCLTELCIQLAVIMVGKQAMNTALEMLFPLFFKWLNTLKVKTGLNSEHRSYKGLQPQWVKDFKLVEWGPRSLFPEYLEMVLQYGFVTIFVAAFPLAPFFALLNNILEMRLDARKLLTYYRRPVTQRVRDIGVWYRILDSIGKLSVITNGFIIAFTSNFIPRLVYLISVNSNHTLDGYLNHTLSYFDTTDFQNGSYPYHAVQNHSICRYPDYREPPHSSSRYEKTAIYWHVLAARLGFVVVFENVVAFVIILVKWCIPDVPCELRDRIRRETYITNEIIIKQETIRANSAQSRVSPPNVKLKASNTEECPTTPEQWDRLVNKSLSGSDFDLMIHGDSFTFSDHKKRNSDVLKSPTSV